MTPDLDIRFVREQFPAFSEPSLHGQHFFENAGGSYACAAVITRLTRYYRETKVQPYYPYPASERAGEAMDGSRARMAAYLGVEPGEVYFGPSTTQNSYVLAQAALGYLTAGDEIVVTNQDHEANSGAWRRLSDRGIVVREWQVDPASGELRPEGLETLLNARTRLVAFPHCSNVVGQINPVRQCADLAHQAGAMTIVDGVSYAPHGFPQIDELGADVYLFSLYKTYGPHQGLMVVREQVADRFSNQGHYFNAPYREKRLVPAGPDHAQIAASQGVIDYFDALYEHHFGSGGTPPERALGVHALFRRAERVRLAPLLDYLREHPRVRLLGPDRDDDGRRAPTLALVAQSVPPGELSRALAARGVMCGDGNFYAPRLLEAMGVDSTVGVNRLSFVHYTSAEDVEHLIAALDALL